MGDVAELAGVSITTVSHVINHSRAVSPEAMEKVRAAITELNYSVNPVARNLRSGSSKMIGVIISNLSNEFYINIGIGLKEILSPAGYRLYFVNSSEDKEMERQNVFDLVSHSADGLIIAPTQNDCSYMHKLIPHSLPTVFIDRKPTGFTRDSVLATNQKGVEEAVSHLIAKGHSRIAFIGSRRNNTMEERLEGYRNALCKAGIPFDPTLVLISEVEPTPMYEVLIGDIYGQMGELLEKAAPTAIMSGNGLATIGIFNYFKTNGIRVPQDIALISFDNHFWYSMLTPGISAVVQDPHEIGIQTGTLMLRRLKGEDFGYQDLRIPTRIILRESC